MKPSEIVVGGTYQTTRWEQYEMSGRDELELLIREFKAAIRKPWGGAFNAAATSLSDFIVKNADRITIRSGK